MNSWGKSEKFCLQWEGRDYHLPDELDSLLALSFDNDQLKSLKDFLENWYSQERKIYQFTSGSTSSPKKIELDKGKMRASAQRTNSFFRLNSQSNYVVCLGLNYVAGKMQLVRAMVSGGNALVTEPELNPLYKIDSSIDFATMVPAQLTESNQNLHKVKTLLLGGGAISSELQQQIAKASNTAVWIGYGMTETYSHIALRQLAPVHEEFYRPMVSVQIHKNAEDCLEVQDDLLELNLQTTDVIEQNAEGNFRVIGRADSIINSGGRKIQPEVLEAQITSTLKGANILVSSIAHPKWGEELVLLVAMEENSENAERVNQALRIIEDSKDRPKKVFFVQEILQTWNGKVDRKANRELAAQLALKD